jgi:hypothetical protein
MPQHTDQQPNLDEILAMPRAEDIDVLVTEVRRLRDRVAEQHSEIAKLVRWRQEDDTVATERRATIASLRTELAATRTKTLTVEADEIVLHCPDHGPKDQDGVWMDCHCAVADDIRRRAALPAP